MIGCLKKFKVDNNHHLPDYIILYRDGLTDKKLNSQGQAEVDGVKGMIERGRKIKEGYDPAILYITATTKSEKRAYLSSGTPGNQGKFAPPMYKNPEFPTVFF